MTKIRLDEILANGNTPTAKARELVEAYLVQEDKNSWTKARNVEYDVMFPTTRVMTVAEKTTNDTDKQGNFIVRDTNYVYPQVTIEYITTDADGNEIRTPLDYVTYSEWLAETKIVTPAVDEVVDADGMVTTPAVEAVTELVREFVPKADYGTEIDTYLANSDAYKARCKKDKVEALKRLTVTTASGKEFFADSESRVDISSAIAVADRNSITENQWKLKTGWELVALDEMKEAEYLALTAKGQIVS